MEYFKYLVFVLSTLTLSTGVKINMKGSVSLGKQVLETLSHMMQRSGVVSVGRRSGGSVALRPGPEQIKWTIHNANIGRGIRIYHKDPVGELIKSYIVILATAIESIFDGIVTDSNVSNNAPENETKGSVFIEELKPILSDIHYILKEADTKIIEGKDTFQWLSILKKISAKYQMAVVNFIEERLDGDPQDILNVKKKLIQKLIIAIILVECKYEHKLCQDFDICEKDHIVTRALHSLLAEFENRENQTAMKFIRYFYENLPEDQFYFLNMETTHEFQVILSDLSYTKDAPAKDVLLSVYKTIDARLKQFQNDVEISKAHDQQLVNIILSDLDYIYHIRENNYPFDNFLQQFLAFLKDGRKLGSQMRKLLKQIREKLQDQPPDLIKKLGYQARVFLELTVDPEK